MPFENPFRRSRPESVSEDQARTASSQEVLEANQRFQRAKEDGLTDEQRTALTSLESKIDADDSLYGNVRASIQNVRMAAERIRSLPAGSREKYDAAFALRNAEYETLDTPLTAPVELWNSNDTIATAAANTERFQEVKSKLETLRKEKEEAQKIIIDLQKEASEGYQQAA